MITSINRSIIYKQVPDIGFYEYERNINKKPKGTKFEEEPNPFDESFVGATIITPFSSKSLSKYSSGVMRQDKERVRMVETEDDMKRKNFLERNRIAALKCRQRKKQWLQNLQNKVEYLTVDNEKYHLEINSLHQELIHLKSLLLEHKECSINQQSTKNATRNFNKSN